MKSRGNKKTVPIDLYRKRTGCKQKERLTVSKEYLGESIWIFEEMASKLTKDLKEKCKS